MRKITDFIVEKRYWIFSFVLLLTLGCFFLSNQVNINRDITKYLPKTSETRIGMDYMESEFKELDESTLNVMFKSLTEEDKDKIYQELEQIPDVKKVEHDDSEAYNKENATLYVLTVDDVKDGEKAKQVYNTVLERYQDYELYTSGDVSEEHKEILPLWIIILAIASAMVILILMCDSFIEPFLFLFTIGLAIVLNEGTNIIFPSISSITSAIVAILQLALSMDYSIMLMNRYRQEKATEADNVKAMKRALRDSFASISSSSITTVVGLLALVFMSFTLGKDLGFVLAKGVLFSLFTIFTCLPALILLFDKIITKTTKKSPSFKAKWLTTFSTHLQKGSIIVFLLIFALSYCFKGNLKILYTDSESDEVGKIFSTTNQMVILYPKTEEERATTLCHNLENSEQMDDILCYGNTINEPLTYKQLNPKLKELENDTEVDEYLLKIIYAHYYQNEDEIKLTFNEFIPFIKANVYANPDMAKHIDEKTKYNIDRLEQLTNKEYVSKPRTKEELAKMFEIEEENVDDLLIYKASLNSKSTLTLNEFVTFMNEIVKPSKYSNNINESSWKSLNTLQPYLNNEQITKSLTSKEMAKYFGMKEADVKNLYLYFIMNQNIEKEFTLQEFTTFMTNNVMKDETYQQKFTEEQVKRIEQLQQLSNPKIFMQKMKSKEMASFLGIDEQTMEQIYFLIAKEEENTSKYTIKEFVTGIEALKKENILPSTLDTSSLVQNQTLMKNETKYSKEQLNKMLGIDINAINLAYTFLTLQQKEVTYTPYEIVCFLSNANLPEMPIEQINMMKTIMESGKNNTSYTYQQLAKLTQMDEQTLKSIYSLAILQDTKISPKNFVDFLLLHQSDETLKTIPKETLENLKFVKEIMNSSLNKKEYKAKELSNLLGINEKDMTLLYGLYDVKSLQKDMSTSYQEFVNFLVENVMSNSEYNAHFDAEKQEKVKTVQEIIQNTFKDTLYTKDELFAITSKLSNDVEKNLIDLLYFYYDSEHHYEEDWTLTIEEFVKYLNETILPDERFKDFIDDELRNDILESKTTVSDAKDLLIGQNYGRIVLETTYPLEGEQTDTFIEQVKKENPDFYIVGNSPMANEMSKTFQDELNFITILTIVFIFIVLVVTFKTVLIPIILVLLIQTAVYLTMNILSLEGGSVYFIALLIVQSILMGSTIDYAILYTSYYLESRKTLDKKEAIRNSYQKSMHTILTSASILTLVTLIVGHFGSAIVAKICTTISRGTICSTLLILLILPSLLAFLDSWIIKRKNKNK